MNDREYHTLETLVAEEKDWGVYALVSGAALGRTEVLKALFKLAAERHDDAAGQKIASWIFHAISDAAFVPHLKEEGGRKFISLPYLAETELRSQVRQSKAEEAMALWPMLPALRSEEDRRYRDRGPDRYPTLVRTKKVVLTEVAMHWSETSDEGEADRIFEFFLGIEPCFEEDRKMVQDVVREVTSRAAPVRLMRHARHAPSYRKSTSSENELKRMMLTGWARRVTFEEANLQFTVLRSLSGTSIACYDLVTDFARAAARLDEAGRFLRCVLGEDPGRMLEESPEGYEKVPGKLVISYPDTRSIEARLAIPHHFGAFEESRGHDWFEAAKRNVLRWQETYPYHVTLIVLVMWPGRYEPDKQLFTRSQRFTPAAKT